MLSALSQDRGVAELLLCVKTMEGQFTSAMRAGAATSVRLLTSPVKPTPLHVGGTAPIPLLTRVRTSIVDPALKLAELDDEESPKILNSLKRHPLVRSGKRLSPGAENIEPPTVKIT